MHSLVIDTEQDFIKLGIATKNSQALGGSYYKLEELSSGNSIKIFYEIKKGVINQNGIFITMHSFIL